MNIPGGDYVAQLAQVLGHSPLGGAVPQPDYPERHQPASRASIEHMVRRGRPSEMEQQNAILSAAQTQAMNNGNPSWPNDPTFQQTWDHRVTAPAEHALPNYDGMYQTLLQLGLIPGQR